MSSSTNENVNLRGRRRASGTAGARPRGSPAMTACRAPTARAACGAASACASGRRHTRSACPPTRACPAALLSAPAAERKADKQARHREAPRRRDTRAIYSVGGALPRSKATEPVCRRCVRARQPAIALGSRTTALDLIRARQIRLANNRSAEGAWRTRALGRRQVQVRRGPSSPVGRGSGPGRGSSGPAARRICTPRSTRPRRTSSAAPPSGSPGLCSTGSPLPESCVSFGRAPPLSRGQNHKSAETKGKQVKIRGTFVFQI